MLKTFFFLALLFFVSESFAQFGDEVSRVTRKGQPYREVIVTVTSPIERCLASSCSMENATIRGLLWLPEMRVPPYRLVVFSHGAQGPTPFHAIGVEPDRSGLPGEFFAKGYAVMMAYRKGRSANDLPKTIISADSTESNKCSDDTRLGLTSATSDVKAYIDALRLRSDLNMNKILLMGHSRGGFVSLSVASEGLPGVVGVVTISSGWLSEFAMWGPSAGSSRCNNGNNERFLTQFGEKIRIPILALYGGKDPFHSAETYTKHMTNLGKNAPADYLIVDGAGHNVLLGSMRKVWEEKQNRFLKLIEQ